MKEGKVLADTAKPIRSAIEIDVPEGAAPSVWDMIIPIAALIITVFGMFLWTGGYPEKSVLAALGSASSMTSLNVAFFVAAVIAMILTVKSRVFSLSKAIDTFFEGGGAMFQAVLILVLAWSIGSVCKGVGTSDYVVSVSKDALSPSSMYLVVFIASCFTAFSTGTSWGVFAIFLPIAIPLALAVGAPIEATIGVVLSGGIFGDHCSPISDTTVLSSMGSSADHIDHVATQLPYALTVAFCAAIGYLLAGATQGPVIGLAATILLTGATVFSISRFQSAGRSE
jgi:Na+/H+ antiporter NhaC